MKKILSILLSAVLIATFFSGCAKTEVLQTSAQTETKSEESQVIMRTGSLMPMIAPTNFSDYSYYPAYYYDDFNSMILAFKAEKIDSMFPFPFVTAKYIEKHVEGVEVVEPQMSTGTLGLCIGTLKNNTEIHNLFNNAIKELSKNGTLDKLKDEYINKYIMTYEDPKPIEMPILDGAKTVKMAVTGDLPPIDFVSADGNPAGFNIALLSEISKLTNTNIELVQMNSGARLTALKTNTVDAIYYNMQVKQENEDNGEIYLQNIDLPDEIIITEPYYTSRIYEIDSSKKLNELIEKGIISPQEKKEIKYTSGMLSFASLTEEEENEFSGIYGVATKYYDNLSSMLLALKAGQIDYISLIPKSTAEYIKARNDDLEIRKTDVTNNDVLKYHMAVLKSNSELYNILNDALKSIINDDTINNIKKKYIDGFVEDSDNPRAIDMASYDGARTIKVAVTGDLPPFDFISNDGEPAGYNVALLSEIGKRAKLNIELVPLDENAKVTALATGNVDVIFWLSGVNAYEGYMFYDCPESVAMTDSYYEDDQYLVYRKGTNIGSIHD